MKTPTIEKRGQSIVFTWPESEVGIALDLLYERNDGIHGEITVQREFGPNLNGHMHWARINLSSTTARDSLRKVLIGKTKDAMGGCPYDWEPMIEYACSVAAVRHREGEPFVHLAAMPVPPKVTYLLGKMLPVGQTSLIYSKGGSTKSLLALAIGASVSSGVILPGGLVPSMRTPVLYLDYEAGEEEQSVRLEWLRKGMGLATTPDVICRYQQRSIASDINRLRREVDEEKVGLVIVDSIAYGLGGGSAMDADVVIEAFTALRSFGNKVTRLVIAHIPKADKEQRAASIYGSVFFENAGRSVWEMRAEDEEDGVSVGLFQRKSNWGKKWPPIGLRFRFDDEGEQVVIRPYNVEDDPELASHGSVSYQILATLRSGSRTPKQVADETGASFNTVKTTLLRLEKRGEVIALNATRGGPGNEKLYGLVHKNGSRGG